MIYLAKIILSNEPVRSSTLVTRANNNIKL